MAIHKYIVTYAEFRIHEVDIEVDTDDMDLDTETDVQEALEFRAVELADLILIEGDESKMRTGLVSLETDSVVEVTN